MGTQRVFVTGLGFVTSIGIDRASVVASLRELRHGIGRYPPFEAPDVPVKLLATVKGFSVDSPDFEDWTVPDG